MCGGNIEKERVSTVASNISKIPRCRRRSLNNSDNILFESINLAFMQIRFFPNKFFFFSCILIILAVVIKSGEEGHSQQRQLSIKIYYYVIR